MIRLATLFAAATFLCGAVSCSADELAITGTRPGLVVLGVASTGKSQEWREGLAGFGIENWVAQALYDTGKYRLIEEQPSVLGTYQPQLEKTYDLAAAEKAKDLAPIGAALHADLIAVAKVAATWPQKSHGYIGIISSDSRDTVVKVDIVLYDLRTGKSAKATGSGKAGRRSSLVGADRPSGLAFDPSTVGPATNAAVEDAISHLVPGYRPRDRSDDPITVGKPFAVGGLPLSMSADVAQMYPQLKTRRVQFGLHNRIVKELSAGGACTLQELNPVVLQALETQWWMASNGAPPTDDVTAHTEELRGKVDWLIYGEVFSFSAGTIESIRGLSGKLANKVTMGVQLRAMNIANGSSRLVMASGTGSSVGDWESWNGQDIDFEQTFVGDAAGKAIAAAWPALLRDMNAGN